MDTVYIEENGVYMLDCTAAIWSTDQIDKYYDSLHYLFLAGKDKPKQFIYIVEYPKGDSTSRKMLRNKLKDRLPFKMQTAISENRRMIEDVQVLNIQEWNADELFGHFPISPAGGTQAKIISAGVKQGNVRDNNWVEVYTHDRTGSDPGAAQRPAVFEQALEAGRAGGTQSGNRRLQPGELAAVIALGHGVTQGVPRKSKTMDEVIKVDGSMPDWFCAGMEAVLLAPTAVNQQGANFLRRRHILPLRKMKTIMQYMDFIYFILIMWGAVGTSAMQAMRSVPKAGAGILGKSWSWIV